MSGTPGFNRAMLENTTAEGHLRSIELKRLDYVDGRVEESERCRHDADDGRRLTIDDERPPDDGRVASEARCQYPYVRITVGGWPGVSSSAENVPPASGGTPRMGRMSDVTSRVFTCSGRSMPVMFDDAVRQSPMPASVRLSSR